MADIFISYKKEDAGRVVRIVEGLRQEGFTVWWDHGIAPGAEWDRAIQAELDAAKCVVAVWSEKSVSAPWVKEEAGVGKARGALVPVRIDEVAPPLGFGLIQAADLWDWDGDIEDPHWDFFIESVRAVLSGESAPGLEKPAKRRRAPVGMVLGGLAALVLVGGGAVWAVSGAFNSNAPASTNPNAPAAARAPSAGEEALFAKAQTSALRTDYQEYLRTFPQGYYAARVREEILPICHAETRKVWAPQQTGQMLRGVSTLEDAAGDAIRYDTAEAACASAKENVEYDANRYCNGFAASEDARNPKIAMTWIDCECQETAGGWWCLVDPTYSCTWEYKMDEHVEVCR